MTIITLTDNVDVNNIGFCCNDQREDATQKHISANYKLLAYNSRLAVPNPQSPEYIVWLAEQSTHKKRRQAITNYLCDPDIDWDVIKSMRAGPILDDVTNDPEWKTPKPSEQVELIFHKMMS